MQSNTETISRESQIHLGNAASQSRIETLRQYAKADAMSAGISCPEGVGRRELVLIMQEAGRKFFMPGDPNRDNQKRNVAIEVFLEFSLHDLVLFAREWLAKWSLNASAPWYKEWSQIIERADEKEITDILLSADQNRARQRLSMPFAQMLGYEKVLKIKREGRDEEV